MDSAVQALHARFAAAQEEAEGEAFECKIVGEAGRCERRRTAVGGVTYVDTRAVAVSCTGHTANIETEDGCRSVLRRPNEN
jgi:hypothetical protein